MSVNSGPVRQQPLSSLRFQRFRLRIVILGVLVVFAFAGSSGYDAWRAYNNTLAATNREITSNDGDSARGANRLDLL